MGDDQQVPESRSLKRYLVWSDRAGLSRKIAIGLSMAAILSGIATLASMSGTGLSGPKPEIVLILLYLDVALMLGLGAIVLRRIFTVWVARRKGQAGSKLLTKIVILFSMVAVTPAILVAVFAALFLNFGVQSWFSERVSTALKESRAVVMAYRQEHRQNIKADALSVVADVDQNAALLLRSRWQFNRFLNTQSELRGLPDVMVIDSNRKIIARSDLSFSLEFEFLPDSVLENAAGGEAVIFSKDDDEKVQAIVRLRRLVDAYLVVGRFIDPKVLEHIQHTQEAVDEYESLEKSKTGIQITFVMIFGLVALLLLLAAAWFGMVFATRLVGPLGGLIVAAERVRRGDMSTRVKTSTDDDEIGSLSRAFNRMTSQLEAQREGLVEANKELDERRRFTETVLEGVSAGVIGLDPDARITLPNRSASSLLEVDLEERVGHPFSDVVPEMDGFLQAVIERPSRPQKGQLEITRNDQTKVLMVYLASEMRETEVLGYVVTFDDVTDLQSAQRTAAWADIARRIAHEIKNPLTPIQLSAERLKRKYLKEINTDPDTFTLCVETIIKHVGDIGRMIDEFSSFARMPQPNLERHDLTESIQESLFLERNRHPEIEFELEGMEDRALVIADGQQIRRAITNILKNAAESVSSAHKRSENQENPDSGGKILVAMSQTSEEYHLVVEDNGFGFPPELKDRLTEPYVTSRAKGTGLGLAIVKKIMEEHGGDLILADREGGGAHVELIFPKMEGKITETMSVRAESHDPMEVATKLVTDGL